jgi:hypothetical protein
MGPAAIYISSVPGVYIIVSVFSVVGFPPVFIIYCCFVVLCCCMGPAAVDIFSVSGVSIVVGVSALVGAPPAMTGVSTVLMFMLLVELLLLLGPVVVSAVASSLLFLAFKLWRVAFCYFLLSLM